jgi:hypothetical protein
MNVGWWHLGGIDQAQNVTGDDKWQTNVHAEQTSRQGARAYSHSAYGDLRIGISGVCQQVAQYIMFWNAP